MLYNVFGFMLKLTMPYVPMRSWVRVPIENQNFKSLTLFRCFVPMGYLHAFLTQGTQNKQIINLSPIKQTPDVH